MWGFNIMKLLMWFISLFRKKVTPVKDMDDSRELLDEALCGAVDEHAKFIAENDAALAQADAQVVEHDEAEAAAMEAAMEAEVDAAMASTGIEPDDFIEVSDVDDALGDLVAAQPSPECYTLAHNFCCEGKKVKAIKLVRADTGWGLKEAKVWVDNEFPAVTIGDLIKEQMEGTTSGGTAPS
jgi:ribosomal protein L7/L12